MAGIADEPRPSAALLSRFRRFVCPTSTKSSVIANPSHVIIACTAGHAKYLLAPASLTGHVRDVSAGSAPDLGMGTWVVDISLDASGTRIFSRLSRELYASGGRLALVVAGRVLSAPSFEGVITDGTMQISGAFTKASATALANSIAGH